MKALNRRTVLASTGSALPAALAGCTAPFGGDEDHPEYTTWIAESVGEEMDHVEVLDSMPDGYHETYPRFTFDFYPEAVEYAVLLVEVPNGSDDTGPTDANDDTSPGMSYVEILVGEFEEEAVADELSYDGAEPLEPTGEYGDYQLYGEDGRVGVRDGTLVRASAAEYFEATVDAHTDDVPRLVDADEEFGLVVDDLKEGDWVQFSLDPRENDGRCEGYRVTYDDAEADLRNVRVYDDASTAEEHESARQNELDGDRHCDVTVEVDGRSVVGTWTTSINTLHPSLEQGENWEC